MGMNQPHFVEDRTLGNNVDRIRLGEYHLGPKSLKSHFQMYPFLLSAM